MLRIGRLTLDDPESFPEPVGESVGRAGGVPVPGGRQGLTVTASLDSFTGAASDTAADRERVRRQLRSLLNNLPMRARGLFVEWTDDPEQDGWYVPGGATFDVAGQAGLESAFWKFAGVELSLIGRPRTHRRAVDVESYDRRDATTPRDFKQRVYGGGFESMTPLSLVWLPSTVTDVRVTSYSSFAMTGPRQGRGGAQVQAIVGASDLAVASFEQAQAHRDRGDVVAYDRRGDTSAPAGGPADVWEEVYGEDWPYADAAADVPVLDNSLCRVRWDASNTPGFVIDLWDGAAYVEQGKVTLERLGDAIGWCDVLVHGRVVEWSPDRAVVAAVVRYSGDPYSREEVFVTLQRGWTGPRFEVYPAPRQSGLGGGVSIAWTTVHTPGATVVKQDSGGAGGTAYRETTGTFSASWAAGFDVGATTFTGENWAQLRPAGGPVVNFAVLQSDAALWAAGDSVAYGALRNMVGVYHSTSGYVSVQLGFSAAPPAETSLEAEAMTLAAGTSAAADGSASNGQAASAMRTSEADHVTQPSFAASAPGKYRVLVRVRNDSAGTLSVRARVAGVDGSRGVQSTTSTSYVWLDLGDVTADGSTLQVRAWRTSAGTFYVDRVVAVPVERRAGSGALYDGARDLGAEVLYDNRAPLRVVPR